MLRTALRRQALTRVRTSLATQARLQSSNANANAKASGSASPASVTQLVVSSILLTAGFSAGYYLSNSQYELSPPEDVYPSSSTTELDLINSPTYATGATLRLGFVRLEKIVGEGNFSYSKPDFANYDVDDKIKSEDEKTDLIVYPKNTQQVSEILFAAHHFSIPVFPISGNTSLEGQRKITQNGVILDLTNLDQIGPINEEDLDVAVGPGVGWADLNEHLAEKELFFAPTPGPGARLGGIINTSASGPNAAKYGTIRENVVNLTVVLADGTIIKTKNRPPKSSAGYNLTQLFIGSEGTLGVVTEATVKVHPKPKYERVSVASFASLKDATNAIAAFNRNGIKAEELQLIDSNLINAINSSGISKQQLEEKPTLFIKIADNDDTVLFSQLRTIEKLAKENKSSIVHSSEDAATTKALWSPVKLAYPASFKYAGPKFPGAKLYHSLDVSVPISNLAQLIEETTKEIESVGGIYIGGYTRADAGNFLPIVLYEPSKKDQIEQINKNLQKRALKLDGTISGQYGVGLSRRDTLVDEFGKDGVDLQRKLKFALDPLRLLNPGKIFKVDPSDTK